MFIHKNLLAKRFKSLNIRIGLVFLLSILTSFFVGIYSNSVFASTYTLSLQTSGNFNINVSPNNSYAGLGQDTLEIISTCPLGYDVTIAGPQDNTLYKDGNSSNTELNKKLTLLLAPKPILYQF